MAKFSVNTFDESTHRLYGGSQYNYPQYKFDHQVIKHFIIFLKIITW